MKPRSKYWIKINPSTKFKEGRRYWVKRNLDSPHFNARMQNVFEKVIVSDAGTDGITHYAEIDGTPLNTLINEFYHHRLNLERV